jgi:hypothetical protein
VPEVITMNQGDTRTFDAGLASVQVGVGSVIVTDGHDSTVVKADTDTDTYDCEGKPSLALYSPDGANVAVTYQDEVETPQEPAQRVSGVSAEPEVSERGDTGGNGGSYESRTLEELRELAAQRNIKGRAGLSKAELIEALRA